VHIVELSTAVVKVDIKVINASSGWLMPKIRKLSLHLLKL